MRAFITGGQALFAAIAQAGSEDVANFRNDSTGNGIARTRTSQLLGRLSVASLTNIPLERSGFERAFCCPRMSTTDATSQKTSFAAPFRHTAFAVIWTATLVSNVGYWMYSAASGWLMTSLNPDPLIVALVQAAHFLSSVDDRPGQHQN